MIPTKILSDLLGSDLLQDGPFRAVIKQHFPEASDVDLYGAGVTIHGVTGKVLAVSCNGRTVRLDGDSRRD